MGGWLINLRTGDWLTHGRMRMWALAVLTASFGGLAFLWASSDGLNDYQGRPLGTDFSNVYAAGTYVLDGRAQAPFDLPAQHAREQAIFGPQTPIYGWHYPPFFLLIAAALASMPYTLALVVWQAVTLALYLLAMRAVLAASWPGSSRPSTSYSSAAGQDVDARVKPGHDGVWLLLALAFPAVFINIGHGHNGFLTAALLGFALVLLDRRPAIAGILFGLLAYKPQFGLLIPLVLIASGRWRTFGAAAATIAALVLVSTIAFGPKVWSAFFQSLHFTRVVVLETGDTGWHKIQSVFSWARMWGGSISLAYAMQGAVIAALAGSLFWLWRSRASFALQAAALCIAVMVATPYSLDYDMMVLAPAIAFFAADGLSRGFDAYEKSALAGLWLMPLIARSVAQYTLIPLGIIVMLAALALVFRRAWRQSESGGFKVTAENVAA
jgi:alpha-1,2-mannosyltransferase